VHLPRTAEALGQRNHARLGKGRKRAHPRPAGGPQSRQSGGRIPGDEQAGCEPPGKASNPKVELLCVIDQHVIENEAVPLTDAQGPTQEVARVGRAGMRKQALVSLIDGGELSLHRALGAIQCGGPGRKFLGADQLGLEAVDPPNQLPHQPRGIAGEIVPPQPERALSRPASLALVDMMRGVVDEGTGVAIRQRFGPLGHMVRPGILAGSLEQIVDRVGQYVDAGADWVIVALRAPFEIDALEMFAEGVAAQFRAGDSQEARP